MEDDQRMGNRRPGTPGRERLSHRRLQPPARVPGTRRSPISRTSVNRLIDRIASFMGATSDTAIIVFDSRVQMLQKIEKCNPKCGGLFRVLRSVGRQHHREGGLCPACRAKCHCCVIGLPAPEDHLPAQCHPTFIEAVRGGFARSHKECCKFSELHYNESQDRGQDRLRDGGQAQALRDMLAAEPGKGATPE